MEKSIGTKEFQIKKETNSNQQILKARDFALDNEQLSVTEAALAALKAEIGRASCRERV